MPDEPTTDDDTVDRSVRLTHIGGPTILIELRRWRILSDPTFDPAGRTYSFGLGTTSTKLTGPAVAVDDLGPIDVVLVSHDHHGDNLDDAGREVLQSAGVVVTNPSAAARLGGGAVGIAAGESTLLAGDDDRPHLRITATPCRHGPPLSRPIVGHVVGFVVGTGPGGRDDVWVTGDTVPFRGVEKAADRLDVALTVVHLGEVRFPVTGPVRYSLTAEDGLRLADRSGAETIVPVHYEGWSHFHQGRAELDRAVAAAPADLRRRVKVLPIGVRSEIA